MTPGALSAVLGWPGNRDCYLMHRMESDGWHGKFRHALTL